MKNIVIYGGGFDPIHNGHMNMALNASKALNAEVFFVPARVAIWKEKSLVSNEDRVNMVNLAIKESNNPRFHICLHEIESEQDINYTIDTVKYFQKEYPDSHLFLLIGTDQVNKFDRWKDCQEIAKRAQIVMFNRPGFTLNQDNIKRFNIVILSGDLIDVASSDVRECKNLNIPYSVIKYIIQNDLYFFAKVRQYIKYKRYLHSVSVAKLAYEIAVSNNIENPWRYFLAGYLHDIGKDMPIEAQEEIIKEFYPQYIDFPKPIIHQFVGAYLAKRDFDIEDEEILEAIMYHRTGYPEMRLMAKVIYASDKIEPTRGFDSSELIENMKVNAEDGFLKVLSANKEYFIKKGIAYDNSLTKATMDKFL